jgi:8-oxo-dGTP pyrophosphatase MutT (NUDIX family)
MQTRTATSHGGVVLRSLGNDGYEVVLCGRNVPGTWQLPKGTPDPGETPEQTALREVQEETGLETKIVDRVGEINYSFFRDSAETRYDKSVSYYLMEVKGGDLSLHDQEFDVVVWRDVREAAGNLTFENESRILEKALALAQSRETGTA